MARQFKFVVKRDPSVEAILYVHDNDTLELVDPDTGMPSQYLTEKLRLLTELTKWARAHQVHTIRFTDENL